MGHQHFDRTTYDWSIVSNFPTIACTALVPAGPALDRCRGQLVYYISSKCAFYYGFSSRSEFFEKIGMTSLSSDIPKEFSCMKLLRSSQWSDIPDLASCIYAGSSPQKGETSHSQECGALRTDHSRGIEDVNIRGGLA